MTLKDRLAEEQRRASEARGAIDDTVMVYRRKLLETIDLSELSKLDPTQRRARLERVVGHLVSSEGPVLSTPERTNLIRRILDEALGLGVLEPLLADQSITEIMVNGPQDVYIERAGRLEKVPVGFASEAQLYQTIDRIVAAVNRRVDESSPMVDARLPTGERVNVIVPPLALSGPTITIRRFPHAYSINDMIRMGTVDVHQADLLGAMVRAKCSMIISGGTGTGKTTMLNALSAFIPERERIVTIEDSAELQLHQEHVISLEARPANVEGVGEVTIRDLVRNALRMRPDRILVGEVRGRETLDMLQAMNTGHEGSLCTVHANSADDAVIRLQTLATMSELAVPYETLRDQINSAVDVIVQLQRAVDGSRRIVEIAAVTSSRREAFRLTPVSRWDQDPIGPDRRVTGQFEHMPLAPRLAERLRLAGEMLPDAFTGIRRQGDDRERTAS